MEKSEKKLTPKQQAFVEIFVKENGRLTATECAKQAGYSENLLSVKLLLCVILNTFLTS